MFAILQDAVDCFQKYAHTKNRHSQRLFLDAYGWICCSEPEWPFSYENICQTLRIDPQWIRSGLARWADRAF